MLNMSYCPTTQMDFASGDQTLVRADPWYTLAYAPAVAPYSVLGVSCYFLLSGISFSFLQGIKMVLLVLCGLFPVLALSPLGASSSGGQRIQPPGLA